jgi:hypothetical protein
MTMCWFRWGSRLLREVLSTWQEGVREGREVARKARQLQGHKVALRYHGLYIDVYMIVLYVCVCCWFTHQTTANSVNGLVCLGLLVYPSIEVTRDSWRVSEAPAFCLLVSMCA